MLGPRASPSGRDTIAYSRVNPSSTSSSSTASSQPLSLDGVLTSISLLWQETKIRWMTIIIILLFVTNVHLYSRQLPSIPTNEHGVSIPSSAYSSSSPSSKVRFFIESVESQVDTLITRAKSATSTSAQEHTAVTTSPSPPAPAPVPPPAPTPASSQAFPYSFAPPAKMSTNADEFFRDWFGPQRAFCTATAVTDRALLPWTDWQSRAQEEIFRHQFPQDCKNKKYLIVQPYRAGIGAMLAVLASQLANAMSEGRIMLLHEKWAYAEGCPVTSPGLSCYMERISNCTLRDAGFASEDVLEGMGCSGSNKVCHTSVYRDSNGVIQSVTPPVTGAASAPSATSSSSSSNAQRPVSLNTAKSKGWSTVDLDCDLYTDRAKRREERVLYCSRETNPKRGMIYGLDNIPFPWAKQFGLSTHWFRSQALGLFVRPSARFLPELQRRMRNPFRELSNTLTSSSSTSTSSSSSSLTTSSTSMSSSLLTSPSSRLLSLPVVSVHVRRGDKKVSYCSSLITSVIMSCAIFRICIM